MCRKVTRGKFKEEATAALNTLETNGGNECYKLIKAKIPTYCTVRIGMAGPGALVIGS